MGNAPELYTWSRILAADKPPFARVIQFYPRHWWQWPRVLWNRLRYRVVCIAAMEAALVTCEDYQREYGPDTPDVVAQLRAAIKLAKGETNA